MASPFSSNGPDRSTSEGPSGSQNHNIRVGIVLQSLTVPAWKRAVVESLGGEPGLDVSVVLLWKDSDSHAWPDTPAGKGSASDGTPWVAALYRRLEAHLCNPMPDAWAACELGNLLHDVDVLKAHGGPTRQDGSGLQDEVIDRIRAADLDVIVNLSTPGGENVLSELAACGVWRYCFGLRREADETRAGLEEVLAGESTTDVALEAVLEPGAEPVPLCRSSSATDKLFVRRSMNRICWRAVPFVVRQLRRLRAHGVEPFLDRIQIERDRAQSPDSIAAPRGAGAMGGITFLGLLARHAWRYLLRKVDKGLFLEQWNLAFDRSRDLSTRLEHFRFLSPPRDRLWADPFVLRRDGTYYVFLEELTVRSNRGHIALLTIDQQERWSEPKPIIDRPYHLSYPFVLEWREQLYLIVEASANRAIEVYRCVEFPDRWEFDRTLVTDVVAVDPTLLEHQGRWWLFANMAEQEGASRDDELFLFHADEPLSATWTPHPRNPIVSDARRSRPAGRIIEQDGKLLRPSQDCSSFYGAGVRVHEIVRLTETDYEEREAWSLYPSWDWRDLGLHTVNHLPGLTVIDVCRRRFRWL